MYIRMDYFLIYAMFTASLCSSFVNAHTRNEYRKTMIDWEILDEVQSMLQNFQHRLNQLEKLDSEGKSQQLELQIQKLERRVQELEKSQNDVSQSPVYRDELVIEDSTEKELQRIHRQVLPATSVNSTTKIVDDHSESWAKLGISDEVRGWMTYGDFHIAIYEHSHNTRGKVSSTGYAKKYYYAPIVLLDHNSANCTINSLSGEAEVKFRIELWNEDVRTKVRRWIRKEIDQTAKDSHVSIIPFDRLALKAIATPSKQQPYKIDKTWIPYQGRKDIWFTLTCVNKSSCDHVASTMRDNPMQFSDLRMLFSLASEKSQSLKTVIRVESILSGNIASKLNQQMTGLDFALITAADEQKLISESATNIMIESFSDSDLVTPQTEAQINNFLKDHLLLPSKTVIKDAKDKLWDSVLWNDNNYRPDMASKRLNEIYKKLNTENQKKLEKSFRNSNKVGNEGSVGVPGVAEVRSKIDVDISMDVSSARENIEKLLDETRDTVTWDGTEFKPKPLSLSKVNLGNLRDTQTFQNNNVHVKYLRASLSLALNMPPVVPIISTKPVASSMPQNCVDLKMMGHTHNGFYLVKSNTKLQTVYCDLIQGSELVIGFNDVKLTPVHFYAQNAGNHSLLKATIPFDSNIRTNIGGAIDEETGIFIAPRTGMYIFDFVYPENGTAVVCTRLNGLMGHCLKQRANLAFRFTNQLQKGNKIEIQLQEGWLGPMAIFKGEMIEEHLWIN